MDITFFIWAFSFTSPPDSPSPYLWRGGQKGVRLSFFLFHDFDYHNADLIQQIEGSG